MKLSPMTGIALPPDPLSLMFLCSVSFVNTHHIHFCSSVEFDSYIFVIHFHHQHCFLFLRIIISCHTIILLLFIDCCSIIMQFFFSIEPSLSNCCLFFFIFLFVCSLFLIFFTSFCTSAFIVFF